MNAITNVGELASPYFLIEVWARRDEIDIDPETFATLKRQARGLVRDARAAQSREEEPDEDWRARRRHLLGLDDLACQPVTLEDGSDYCLASWRDGEGREALLVAELEGFADPDHRAPGEPDPPSTRFELALDAYRGRAEWGLLLAGLDARLYRRSSGISQQYLALSLDALVELDDEATWKAFAALFRSTAFAPDADGVPLVRRVVDESRRHAAALAADMRADVIDAAEALIRGVLAHPANAVPLGRSPGRAESRAAEAAHGASLANEPGRALLHQLFEETLYYLYRVLFVLYAESRDVLALSGKSAYATTYSLDHLVERARDEPEHAEGDYYQASIARLFSLLWDAPAVLTRALGIQAVGGELFDPARTALLDGCAIGDAAWRRALTSIAMGAPGSGRRRLGRRSSFAELGVDQLGSIYEGLLVLEPYLAPGPRALVALKGERRVVDPGQEGGGRVLAHLVAGDFVLESASGRRKGSGSFYTPAEITEYLAHGALDPLVEPILARAAADPRRARADILALRVCDPAMGSGAFLVQAARVLGLAAARASAAGRDGRVTPAMVHQAEREVVRRCLYGVDLNPLAVVLAKVSLWLETLETGRPLSYLDAHLRCGDSLVGVDLLAQGGTLSAGELAAWPADATKGLTTY
ncbi:MAG: N-6 DNA methylase, partial [Acidimicrobiales bacterium]